MIRHVWEGVSASGVFDEVIVATDDQRIADVVRGFGGEARLTRTDHKSGTDRVAEIALDLRADVVVNVQGDLPFVDRLLVEPPVARMRADRSVRMATLSVPIVERDRWLDPNVVKVVTDAEGFALYFSRAPIPAIREDVTGDVARESREFGRQHVGLYAYRREFLLEFASWEPTPLERLERLEQLRALERGVRVYVAAREGRVVEVDTPQDLERAGRLPT